MIKRSAKLLRPGGRLVFSTNYTRFKLDADALSDFAVEDIGAATIPKDFERHARIHSAYSLRLK
jgi:23S rRNA (guanine2445-N2)-methyltransferase / 23S rRNA (guanine2069-N7)-methyltransferase